MRRVLMTALAAAALVVSSPASAAIVNLSASASQGTNVHNPGAETVDYDVVANLGAGGPNIVHFTGDTTQTVSTSDLMRLKNGQGQSEITGAVISGNNTYPLYSGDIFLTGHAAMTWIELALTGTINGGTVDFVLTDGNGVTTTFSNLTMGNGDTHFGFGVSGGSVITNLHFSSDTPPGTIDQIKQVRIITAPGVIPEPATWAMMLLGFGGIGMTLHRSRKANGRFLQVA